MEWREATLFGEIPDSLSGHSLVSYKTNSGAEKLLLFGGIAGDFVRNNYLYEFSLIQNSTDSNNSNSTPLISLSSKLFSPDETAINSCQQDSTRSKIKSKSKKESKVSSKQPIPTLLKIPEPRERHAVSILYVNHPQTNQTLCFMILMGGIGNLKTKFNDVWIFDLQKMKWRETKCKNNTSIPSPRYNHQLCTINDRLLFLFGGYEGEPLNDCWLLFIDLDSLLQYSTSQTNQNFSTEESLTVSIEWKEIKSKPTSPLPKPRYQHAMIPIHSNKFAIIGGTTSNRISLNDVWLFDLETYHFSQLFPKTKEEADTTTPSPDELPNIHAHQVALISNQLVVIGGLIKRNKSIYNRDVYLFDLSTLQWNRISFSSTPSISIFMGRINFGMCVIQGNQLLVFGGVVENAEKGLAFKYNDCLVLDTKIKLAISNTTAPVVSQKRIHNFLIEKLIGSGGQATVFLVKEETTMQSYAMKRVLIDFSAEGATRSISSGFALNEIILMNKLQHENILSLKAFFLEKSLEQEDQIKLNLIMPYCEMGDLQRLMHRKRSIWSKKGFPSQLDELEVLQWMLQMSQGIEYIHKNHIIHRDLKPSNIFVTKQSLESNKELKSEYLLKIGDFGLAKNVQVSLAKTMVGTPAFMSPQLYNNEPYSFDADIWSLGCIFFWILTDKTVDFKFTNQLSLLQDEMSKLQLKSRDDLYLLIKECLQEPKKRPTASLVTQRLAKILFEKFQFGSCKETEIAQQIDQPISDNVVSNVNTVSIDQSYTSISQEANSIQEWLTSIDLEEYIPTFMNNGYTSLLDVESRPWSDEDLKSLGIDVKLARNLLLQSISKQYLSSQLQQQKMKMEQMEHTLQQVKALVHPF